MKKLKNPVGSGTQHTCQGFFLPERLTNGAAPELAARDNQQNAKFSDDTIQSASGVAYGESINAFFYRFSGEIYRKILYRISQLEHDPSISAPVDNGASSFRNRVDKYLPTEHSR